MWLIDQSFLSQIENVQISAADLREFEARMGSGTPSADQIMDIKGGVATIALEGPLTARPNFMAMLFGGGNTTYPQFINALAAAEADADVKETQILFNSPGGTVDGLFPAMEALRSATKPTTAIVTGTAASAAYGLASQAGKIVADNKASRVGSVGVVVDVRLDKNAVSIASSNAPKKRPDASTEEGQADIREELDDIEALFIEEIAAGRGVSLDKVKADFGRGGSFTAEKALKAGMIDAIRGKTAETLTPATPSGNDQTGEAMDLTTLKASHREVYLAAVQEGIAQERERVEAHLELGEAYGALDTAMAAIKDGSDLTTKLQAKYLAAGANRSAVTARADDNANVEANSESNVPNVSEKTAADSISAIFKGAAEVNGVDLGGAR